MKLVIDRSKWLRGEGEPRLLRKRDGKMCCLGFYGLACGLTPEEILDEGEPHLIRGDKSKWPAWMLEETDSEDDDGDLVPCLHDSPDTGELMNANDTTHIPEEKRELVIASIFAKHGVEVEFVDGPVSP